MEEKKSSSQTKDKRREFNLRFYNEGCEVPSDALKAIRAGRLTGMSDVNPMWRMKRMTEMFGPCGIGWKYTIDKQWTECYGNEVKCFCNVSLYILDPETKEWSAPIPGNGGSSIVSIEKKGPYVNDEAYKMALTDALSIAMKPLGIGANVWYGPKATGHNESKYEEYTRVQSPQPPLPPQQPQQPVHQGSGLSAEQIAQAFKELNDCKSHEEVKKVFLKYESMSRNFTANGTSFYKKTMELANKFKTA